MKSFINPQSINRLKDPFMDIFIPFMLSSLLALTAWKSFLLFHILAESFAAGVAIIMFVIAWHTFQYSKNQRLMYLGIGFFWVGILDISHAFTYKGMNLIHTQIPDVTTQIWIASRFLQTFVLLTFPIASFKWIHGRTYFFLFGIYSALILTVIFTDHFPTCFIEGKGLTPFKIYSEYTIILFLLVSAIQLWARRNSFDPMVSQKLIFSILITCLSEISFTFYKDVYGISNVIGHVFKYFAFWIIYLAIIKSTLQEPFRIMSHSTVTYDAIPEIIFMMDDEGYVKQVNDYTYKLLNMSPTDVLEKHCHSFFHDNSISKEECLLCNYIKRKRKLPYYEFFQTKTQEWKSVSLTPLEEPFSGIIEVNIDITQRKIAEERLFEEKERIFVTLQSIGDGVITTDSEGIITNLNPVAEDLTLWKREDALGQKIDEVFNIVNDVTGAFLENPIQLCLQEQKIVNLPENTALIRKNGTVLSIDDSAAPIRDRYGNIIGSILVFHDVSTERELKNKLAFHASHDNLTGLLNRFQFENRLIDLLVDVKTVPNEHAVLFIDLDQFKIVNDTSGHMAGDEVLRQLSLELKKHIRTTDTLARLGGDEFGLILHSCDTENARNTAEKIRKAVRDYRFVWHDNIFELGCSIGITAINENSLGKETLMSEADMACYAAKEAGRNKIHVFSSSDNEITIRKNEMQWVNRINKALKKNQFRIYQQPIQSVNKNDTNIHCEILIRLHEEDNTIRLPGSFLPAAERYNLMTTIDKWVVNEVFNNLDKFTAPNADSVIAINLSGFTLSDLSFLDEIYNSIIDNNLPAGSFCFEITETSAIANLQNAIHFINKLKSIGCLFALDDFGSGVSSFSYLKNLNVDFVKIDGSFIKNIETDLVSFAMVESIHKISRVMGIRTIAEFVESEAILNKLEAIGIDFAQGYHIGKPKLV